MIVKAVLFDMDGTVVDSVPAWYETFNQALEQTGGEKITYKRFCEDILGQSTTDDVTRFFPNISVEDLTSLYTDLFPKNIGSVKLFADTTDVLNYLKQNKILVGLVTNTPRDLMLLTLDTLKIRQRFDTILGGDDVSVGKPEPEMIHKACEVLGVAESETLMVGDTSADINSGGKAGCTTIGVKLDGDWRIESLAELIPLLEALRKQ